MCSCLRLFVLLVFAGVVLALIVFVLEFLIVLLLRLLLLLLPLSYDVAHRPSSIYPD